MEGFTKEFIEFVKQVDAVYYRAEEYDVIGLAEIGDELDKIAEPYEKEIEELMENEAVKKYIEAKDRVDYVRHKRISLCGYYPK